MGIYDYYTVLPTFIDLFGQVDDFYGSTWIMNMENIHSMFKLYDKGLLKKINILTGIYFKNRDTNTYGVLTKGLEERKQRYKASENHAKIILIRHKNNYIAFEGSANFTRNWRIENFVMVNNKKIYDFHKGWMEEIFNA
jgi:hypothetical protein